MKKGLIMLLVIVVFLTACGGNSAPANNQPVEQMISGVPEGVQGGKKVAVIRNLPSKDYDGLIISHGKKDYSYDMLKPTLDKGSSTHPLWRDLVT